MAIASLTPGTKVLATNTQTGKTEAKTVEKVWVNHDTDLMDLTVSTRAGSSVIHATQRHLFWDETTHSWVEADRLRAGDRLRSDNGATVTFQKSTVIPGAGDMWDLTIQSDHDFYVEVTSLDSSTNQTSVLVHNCPLIGEDGAQFASRSVGQGKGWRIDVENPNPGQRAGQIHLQDYSGNKYLYNFGTGEFEGAPRSLLNKIPTGIMVRSISKAMSYLGQ